ncbi:MAG: porin [Dongiaceae bacterium]
MKKVLMGSSALLAAGFATSPAFADDGIKLSLGGFFQTAVEENIDDHGHNDLGNKRYNDGVFSDAEIYVLGKTTLDNGLTVGARVELEGEQQDDQIDQAYVYFQGGFGEFSIGSSEGALETLCVTPVGGTANFGAFSQDQVINNAFSGFSAGVCNGADAFRGQENSQKIVYITPNFGGFQLALSWSPNGNHESDGVTDFHSGMPTVENGEQRNVVDAYANYSHDFDTWSMNWGGGASVTTTSGGDAPSHNRAAFYQSALNLTFGNLSVGVAGEYYGNGVAADQDGWVVGGGVAYKMDAWTFGFQYSHANFELDGPDVNREINTTALTTNYALGPGINLDGTVQYTWADGDHDDEAHGGYKSVGLGLGTSFTF